MRTRQMLPGPAVCAVVGAALLAAACSNSRPAPQGQAMAYGQAPAPTYAPAPAPSYGPAYAATPSIPSPPPPPTGPRAPYTPTSSPAYAGPAAPAPQPGPSPSYAAGPWRWHTRIADAQADARAQGKLILVTSTKPDCGLCEKFKERIVPQCQAQVGQIAVGYVYQILRPEDVRVDRLLRANLPGASLMPLVGFVTADLQWVHGFYGQTDVNKFLGDVQVARARAPVGRAMAAPAAGRDPLATVPVSRNEYGEYDWSPLDEVVPEDALKPEEALAAAPPAPEPVSAPLLAVAAPRRIAPPVPPAAPDAPPALAAAPRPVEAPPVAPDWSEPALPAGGVAAAVRAPAQAPEPGTAAWAETMMDAAKGQIREGRLDEARVTLSQVIARLDGDSAEAVEAARGTVAIYNSRRIERAAPEERATLSERARRDLGTSRWADLFLVP